ncbi:MAG: hypothetical protein JEY97_05075 [Bacteroidales bacterium]|nr:hypothetical protein [Bacteroidales bacterium]
MTGIILMTIGIIVFVVGIIIYNYSSKENQQKENGNDLNEQKNKSNELDKIIEMAIADGILTNNERTIIKKMAIGQKLDYKEIIRNAEKNLSELKTKSETELIDYKKKKGDDFEKFIVQKFNKQFFRIKEWAGDKYVNGIYAETTPQPDILLEFSLKEKISNFAVECKWRQNFYKNGIEFANKDQFNRYKNYEKNKKIPVFIAIGIGGEADSPEYLYIVPLKIIESNFIHISELKKFKKNVDKDFYFDNKTKKLK